MNLVIRDRKLGWSSAALCLFIIGTSLYIVIYLELEHIVNDFIFVYLTLDLRRIFQF